MPANYQQYAITLTVLFIRAYINLVPRLYADLNKTLGRTQLVRSLLPLVIHLTRNSGQRCPGSHRFRHYLFQGPAFPKGSCRRST